MLRRLGQGLGRFRRQRAVPVRPAPAADEAATAEDPKGGADGGEEDEEEGEAEEGRAVAAAPAFGGLDHNAIGHGRRRTAVVDTPQFTLFMGVVILINLVTVGLETDMHDGDWPEILGSINSGFLLLYIAELVVRFMTHGPAALRDYLTTMDLFIVLVTFIERIVVNSHAARALPVFRLFRALKSWTGSMSGSAELRMLIATARQSIFTLAWMSLVLFLTVLACSSFAKYAIGDSAEWVGSMDPFDPRGEFERFDNREYFGSTFRSFLTMMQVMSTSQWGDVARRVALVYPISMLFFFYFVIATTYGLVTCVAANTVQAAMHTTREQAETKERIRRAEMRDAGNKVFSLLERIDKDRDGIVQASEIDWALRKTNLPVLLQQLNAPDMDGARLIRTFDKVGNRRVTHDEIVEGLIRMDEEVRTKDFVRLNMWAKNCLLRAQRLGERVTELVDKCHELRVTMEKAIEAVEYFQGTKEMTEMRFRAIQQIRSAPPMEAPKLRGWKPPKEPKYPPEDEAMRFCTIAASVLGGRGPIGAPPAPMYVARRTELPPAPPSAAEQSRLAKKEEEALADKYAVVRNPAKDYMPGPSPSLTALRELLS